MMVIFYLLCPNYPRKVIFYPTEKWLLASVIQYSRKTTTNKSNTPRKQFFLIKETFLWYTVKEKISLS